MKSLRFGPRPVANFLFLLDIVSWYRRGRKISVTRKSRFSYVQSGGVQGFFSRIPPTKGAKSHLNGTIDIFRAPSIATKRSPAESLPKPDNKSPSTAFVGKKLCATNPGRHIPKSKPVADSASLRVLWDVRVSLDRIFKLRY